MAITTDKEKKKRRLIPEIAGIIGVSIASIHTAIRKGHLKAWKNRKGRVVTNLYNIEKYRKDILPRHKRLYKLRQKNFLKEGSYYTTKQMSKILNIPLQSIRHLIRQGKIKAQMHVNFYFISSDEKERCEKCMKRKRVKAKRSTQSDKRK